MPDHPITLFRFGVREYRDAFKWQQETAVAVRKGLEPEAIALLQHPPVFTLGRRAPREHLLAPEAALRAQGADIVETDRGGDITFHGPGQLVCYPILDLKRRDMGPVDYVRALESVMITTLRSFGVKGERLPGFPGVWAEGGKIGAVGVRIQGGVSTHGFALNVDPDLDWFSAIIPCGLPGVSVTSMASLLPAAPSMTAVEDNAAAALDLTFGALVPAPVSESKIPVAHGS
jgi:lipoate-protein ligase B